MAKTISFSVSDGLDAKITEHWGSTAAFKDAVKRWARTEIVEGRKRAAYEQRMGQFEADVEQIVGEDAADG